MAFDIYLPSKIYSKIPEATEVNRVQNLTVLDNTIKVGNWYIPIAQILCIKEV